VTETDSDSDDDQNGEDDPEYEERPETRVHASLGSATVTVRSNDPEEAERLFEETWERVMEDAEEASKALRDGTRSCQ